MTSKWSGALTALLAASTVGAASGFTGRIGGVPSAFVPAGTSPRRSPTALAYSGRRGRPKGPVRTIVEKPPMNNEIEFDELRVVALNPSGGKDEALGVMSKPDAITKAQEMGGLDLILINPQTDPPVCKIADYSKYRYIEEKKKKEKAKKSKGTEIKEVKMSYKIDVHDYEVRKKNASKFLQQGNRVKCSVMFRGREIQHDNLGFDLLNQLADDMNKICTMEGKPKREGRNLSCILSPRPEILKNINDAKRKAEKDKKKKREERLKKAQAATTAVAAGAAVSAAAVQSDTEAATIAEEDLDIDLSALGEEDDDTTLDELLGGDALTDELFG